MHTEDLSLYVVHVWKKNFKMENNLFYFDLSQSKISMFWNCGGPGIVMFCLKHSDLWQGNHWQGESPGGGTAGSWASFLFCLQIHAFISPPPQLSAWRAQTGCVGCCGSWELVKGCCKNTGLVANLWEVCCDNWKLVEVCPRSEGLLSQHLRTNSGLVYTRKHVTSHMHSLVSLLILKRIYYKHHSPYWWVVTGVMQPNFTVH